jgi:type I restriction enzyme S subunit
LIKAGKLKKENPLPEISEDEIISDIPDNWCWVRLGEITSLVSGRDMTPDKYSDVPKGIPYITGASNFSGGTLIINRWTQAPESFAYYGDLLITCKGTIGELAFLNEEACHIARQVMALKGISHLNMFYVHAFLSVYVDQLKRMAKSMIPGISREMILEALVPLPPIAEQHRIVDRLNRLLPLCDTLE